MGDPDFSNVPRGLVDKTYARELADKIDLKKATPVDTHGQPPKASDDLFGKHTTHIAAADADGNWVAITTTVNTAYGSKVVVPGTGVVLNNQMDDFAIAPGVPNSAGLVGADANAVAPGKRPLSSMSPTIVLRDGKPVLTLGAAGGPTIITQVVMGLVYRLDLQRPLSEAMASPRIHHQWRPNQLRAEAALGDEVLAELRNLGHHVKQAKRFGGCPSHWTRRRATHFRRCAGATRKRQGGRTVSAWCESLRDSYFQRLGETLLQEACFPCFVFSPLEQITLPQLTCTKAGRSHEEHPLSTWYRAMLRSIWTSRSRRDGRRTR